MPNKEDLEDVLFMEAELIRFLEEGPELLKNGGDKAFYDFMCNIPKRGGGMLIWGQEAERRSRKAVKRHLAAHRDLAGRLTLDTAYSTFKKVFSEMIQGADRNVDARFVDQLFGRFISYIRRNNLKEFTHYIPCNLTADEQPVEFSVGPVTFVRAEKWLKENEESIKANGVADYYNEILMEVKNLHWLAVVTVMPCDEVTSRERAYLATEAALNVLRLYLPLSDARKFRSSRKWMHHNKWHGLTKVGNRYNVSWTMNFAPLFQDAWIRFIQESNPVREAAGTAIDAIVNDPTPLPLRQRLLDALRWYGDACEDESEAATIVKCAAALERVTMARPRRSEIRRTVVSRAAYLVAAMQRHSVEKAVKLVDELYEARSRFMHGDRSPFTLDKALAVEQAIALTRDVLIAAVPFYVNVRGGRGSDDELEAQFEKVVPSNSDGVIVDCPSPS